VVGNSPVVLSNVHKSLRNCRFLLATLVALVLAFPFLKEVAAPLVLVIPLAGVFLAGVVVTDSHPVHLRRAALTAAAQVGLTLLSIGTPAGNGLYKLTVALALLATLALILLSIWCVLGYVLRAQVITRDQIYAGICVYIMLGFAFGALFYLINILDPSSFAAAGPANSSPDLMYFSFVTLATLGYGDIAPRTPAVRALAVLEALVGMIYIAVFMARLVSMRSTDSDLRND
jgi:ion channel